MELTGKCLTDFNSFLLKNYNETIIKREAGDWNHGGEIELSTYDIFDEIPCITRNAIIIDFFDSVKIFITTYSRHKKYEDGNIWYFQTSIVDDVFYSEICSERSKSIKQAIIRANEIYNSKQ